MTRHSSDDEQLREPDNGGMPAVKPCTPAEYAADLTFIVDANMAIRSVNRLPAGRRPDDVLQNSVLSVVSSEHRDALKGTFRQALDTGEVKSTDVVLDLPDCRGHFRVHLYPLASGADDGDAIAMTATDISEHAATKERLQQIARERSALLDALPNHAILHSPDLKIVWPNEAACRSVDLSREELIGRHCYQVSMERDDPCPDCPVMKAMQTGQPDEIAEKETPDGRIWHVIGRPLRDDAGEIIGGVEITEDITERVRTERALRESEERYRALYEGSRDAIMILAPPDWNFSSCNPATVKLFGAQDEDEVTSLGPWEVSPEYQPDGRLSSEKAKAMIETAMEEGSHFFEWTHQRLDGTEFPTTVLLTRMEIQGQPLVKATVRDITEQKRMQEELQASEKRFREMVNTLPQFYGEFDLEGQFTFLNETALELLGLTQEDLERGINAAEFVHPKDRERMSENVQKALRGEKTGASEYRMRRKDGSFVPTLVYSSPIIDDGEPVGLRIIVVNITERKQMEEELRASEKRFRDMVNTLPQAYGELDAEGNFTFLNQTAFDVFGYTNDDLEDDLNALEFMVPEDRERALANMQKSLRGQLESPNEYTMVKKDGSLMAALVYSSPIVDDGEPVGLRLILIDITERRRAQEKLRDREQRLNLALKGGELGTWDWDLRTDEVIFNDRWAEMKGFDPDEIEPHLSTWEEMVHPDDMPQVRETLDAHLNGDTEFYEAEFRMQHKSGQWVWILDRGQVIERDDEGNPVRACGTHLDITERKRMENKLRASEKQFREMVNTLPQAYGELDAEGNFTFLNQTAFDVFGYTNDDLEDGLNTLELGVPEDRERALANMQKSLRGQLESPNEYTMVKKDGSRMAALVYSSPIVDDGEPVGLRLIFVDITDRRRAQEKLRDREQRLNLALKGGELGTWDWDLRTDEVIFNDRWAEMKGYDPDEIDPHLSTWEEMVHPDDMPQVRETLDAYLNGDTEFYEAEFRMQHKSGQWVWILDRGQVIERDDDGNPVRACGTHLDITERKRAEQKLLLRSELLDAANDAIMFHDLEGNFRYVNQTACDRYDYTYEEFTDMNVRQLETPDSAAKVGRRVDKLLKYGQLKFESEQQRNDGSIIPVEINSRVINLDGDRYILSAVRDITERKQAERKLRKALNEAETLNEELQKQTKRANEMAQRAEEANAAKSEFLANMSHEIRTPMNAIIGMTGLLLDSDLGQQQRQYAGTVRASGESLLNIINDILDFSKIEAGRLEMETLDFNLHDMLDDFAQLMGVKAQDKGLEFVCAAHPDVPAHLEGDAGRLRQVLTNLAGNAIKFTEQGEVAVRVGVEDQDEDNVTLGFSVRDTGIGISQDEVDTLFEEFLQVDTSTTRRFGGTGLGLAISRQLVEKMGGEIGAESEKGEGSEFWFTAQFEKQADHELPTKAPDKVPGARILVVDDNATNREILTAQLESWEARVGEAAGGESALDILRGAAQEEDAFDAAILDMQMPHMDGETLGRRIKNDPQLKSIQLVLMTSLGQPEDLQRLRDIGFATCLTKPVTKSELFDCLACILNGGEHEAERDSDVRTDHSLEEIASKDLRILVAEDNITNQQVALGMLEKLGVTADAVANGAEAVEALETIPYDMVLMDVQMPEMDGFEATRHIRDPETGVLDHEIPIIAMTAHAMKGDREKCLEAGMDDYIAKPVERHKLAGLLREWIPERDEPGERDADGAAHSDKQVASEEASEDVPEPVFDREAFIERMMGNEDLAAGVAESFLEDIPERIRRLREYIDAEDNSGVQRQAHTIKGAAANVGGETVRAVAFKIEKGAADGDMPAADSYLPELQAEFERLKEAMEELTE